jgi:hypothetical protein
MVICLATFIVLALGMLLWPIVRLVSRESARKLSTAFKLSTDCIAKRTTFQKCEVRFEDRVKNLLLKSTILKYPHRTKHVAALIYLAALLILALTSVGLLALIWWLIALAY